jgi:hypothetical protein
MEALNFAYVTYFKEIKPRKTMRSVHILVTRYTQNLINTFIQLAGLDFRYVDSLSGRPIILFIECHVSRTHREISARSRCSHIIHQFLRIEAGNHVSV